MPEAIRTEQPEAAAGQAERIEFSEFIGDRLEPWKSSMDQTVYEIITADYKNMPGYTQEVDPAAKLIITREEARVMTETWDTGSRRTVIPKNNRAMVKFEEVDGSLNITTSRRKEHYHGREALFQEIICKFDRTKVGQGYLLDGEEEFFTAASSLYGCDRAWFHANLHIIEVDGEQVAGHSMYAVGDRKIGNDTYMHTYVERDTKDYEGAVRAGSVEYKEGENPPTMSMEVVA